MPTLIPRIPITEKKMEMPSVIPILRVFSERRLKALHVLEQ